MGSNVHHALIIAAGRGARFGAATHFRPKPLIEVAGVPLICRTLLTARKAGIDHFTVVTGYKALGIEEFLNAEIPPGHQGPVPAKRPVATPERSVRTAGERTPQGFVRASHGRPSF